MKALAGNQARIALPKRRIHDEKDVLFYGDAPDMHFALKDGQLLFLP